MRLFVVLAAVLTATGCGQIEQKSAILKPTVLGQPYSAGPGDVVLDMKTSESLPNVAGKADIFGRTRDTGRLIVRFAGMEGSQAVFVRQDTTITSNETTMSRSGYFVPAAQQSTMTGNVGAIPVNATQTTVGSVYVPPTPSTSYASQSGIIPMAAAPGGSVIVEGRRITFIRPVDGGIEYSVR